MRLFRHGLICLLLPLIAAPVLAQSDTQSSEATIAFQIHMDKLCDSPLGEAINLRDKLSGMKRGDGPDMSKIDKIFGGAVVPGSVEAIQDMQRGNVDENANFFLELGFQDQASSETLLDKAKEKNGGVIEKSGLTYYLAPEGDGPKGMVMVQPSEGVIQVASESFAYLAEKPMSEIVGQALGRLSGEPAVSLAFDLESNAALVDQLVEMGTQAGGNPMVSEMLPVVTKLKSLSVAFDLNSENLLVVQAIGKSDAEAEEVKEAMDALMFFAKQGIQMQSGQMKQSMPEVGATIEAVGQGLAVVREGSVVNFSVPKTEGFEEAVSGFLQEFGPMMGM